MGLGHTAASHLISGSFAIVSDVLIITTLYG